MATRILVLALAVFTPVLALADTRLIRVLFIANDNSSAVTGAHFGAAEAARTAKLVGRDFQLFANVAAGEVDAIVVCGSLPRQMKTGRTPVLQICRSSEEIPQAFTLAPSRGPAWQPALEKIGAGELNQRFRKATGRAMDSDAYMAWLAMKIIVEAQLREQPVDRVRVDGHKGVPLRFNEDRVLVQPAYE